MERQFPGRRVSARLGGESPRQGGARDRHVERLFLDLDRDGPAQARRPSADPGDRRGPSKASQANFRAAGLDSVITLKLGDALREVPKLRGPYDFVFIDAWKQDYVKYLDMVIPMVRPGGVIVAHNVTNLKEELTDFIRAVQTNPQLKTSIENPGPGGFSVSYKLPAN